MRTRPNGNIELRREFFSSSFIGVPGAPVPDKPRNRSRSGADRAMASNAVEPENRLRRWSALALDWRYCSGSCSNSTPFILSRVRGSGPRPSAKANSSTRRPCSSPGRPKFPSTQRGSV